MFAPSLAINMLRWKFQRMNARCATERMCLFVRYEKTQWHLCHSASLSFVIFSSGCLFVFTSRFLGIPFFWHFCWCSSFAVLTFSSRLLLLSLASLFSGICLLTYFCLYLLFLFWHISLITSFSSSVFLNISFSSHSFHRRSFHFFSMFLPWHLLPLTSKRCEEKYRDAAMGPPLTKH